MIDWYVVDPLNWNDLGKDTREDAQKDPQGYL